MDNTWSARRKTINGVCQHWFVIANTVILKLFIMYKNYTHTCTTVQLLGTANTFRGFLIQAREGGNYIGRFTDLPALTQTLDSDASNPAVHYEMW